MGIVTLDFGQQVDILNKRELQDALREDAMLRRAITGVKIEEFFSNQGLGPNSTVPYFITPPNMVGAGLMWAVMNAGLELTSNVVSRVYKMVPPGPTPTVTTGAGRCVQVAGSSATPNFAFSKGQLTLRAGEQLTFMASGAGNISSVFIAAISIPAERFAELLI